MMQGIRLRMIIMNFMGHRLQGRCFRNTTILRIRLRGYALSLCQPSFLREPTNLLESIICDSDLDYLGRSDFIPVSNTLYEELKAQNKMKSLNDWNKLQVKFISGHQYFTKTARSLREVNKQLQIERIQSLITD